MDIFSKYWSKIPCASKNTRPILHPKNDSDYTLENFHAYLERDFWGVPNEHQIPVLNTSSKHDMLEGNVSSDPHLIIQGFCKMLKIVPAAEADDDSCASHRSWWGNLQLFSLCQGWKPRRGIALQIVSIIGMELAVSE